MRKNRNECVTLEWDGFYKFLRAPMAEVIYMKTSKQLKRNDYIIYGNNVSVTDWFLQRPSRYDPKTKHATISP